ncbi:hypothetical protein [Streptomyces varsoviensis]|uniref:Uncharacterized protein n=1 Tax=Streptomyces varsoviensis TaxID=67373 RepID=A0ABR5IVP5_9ACTN|nr:hypothetical protein [Streptomyces varsoviensis]KOG85217.1 hypothetical protein ADK38_38005 [Streptomyces varsoviensis]
MHKYIPTPALRMVVALRAKVRKEASHLARALRVELDLALAIRATAGLTYTAGIAALIWALGIDTQPVPHTGVLVLMWIATGSAVVRALLMWIRRFVGRHRTRPSGSGVSLRKTHKTRKKRVAVWNELIEAPDESEGWAKARRLLVNVALLAASLTAAMLPSLPSQAGLPAALQRAGAEVTTATIAERPEIVRKEYDEDNHDVVVSYYSKLRVSVPGGAERLVVGPVSSGKPFKVGSHIPVLWSPSNPALGGYTGSPAELKRLTENKWEINLTGSDVSDDILVTAAWISGLVMLPWVFMFAFGIDGDVLSEMAWSPLTQTIHALVFLGAAYGSTPALTGQPPNGLQSFWQVADWVLLAGLIFSPIGRLLKDNWRNAPMATD